jgi:CheY-like chemotaxis protein
MLPLDRARGVAPAAIVDGPQTETLERTLKVLAAEDNPVNQMVLKTLLHQAGVDPRLVGDGKAALDAWEAEDWDLILMDMQMPVMDGLGAARAIRAREAATGRPRTPIIALTANVMAHQVSTYLEAGMDQFVGKPIEVGALFAAMDSALSEGGRDAAAA